MMQDETETIKGINGGITSVEGFQAAGLPSGIKKEGHPDLALIYAETPCDVAALFTKNQFCAAPLLLNKQHLRMGKGRAIIINSGNANAFTGTQGERDAETMAKAAGQQLKIPTESVYVASTGVIGEKLPISRILKAIPSLSSRLSKDGSSAAAEAIMTTDTFLKEVAYEGKVGTEAIRVGGIAKGSGMIHPNMATMLAFLSTDMAIEAKLLQEALREAVDHSFHCITIDGDTSTSDMVLLFSNGQKEKPIQTKGTSYRQFVTLLTTACLSLAKMLVQDGEGASKLISIRVTGAKNNKAAHQIASSIACSLLVKTAFFGEDANWGRIVAAIGNAGAQVSPEEIDLAFGPIELVRDGIYLGKKVEDQVSSYLKRRELDLCLTLHSGNGTATVWTTDLGYDYIKINASYRT